MSQPTIHGSGEEGLVLGSGQEPLDEMFFIAAVFPHIAPAQVEWKNCFQFGESMTEASFYTYIGRGFAYGHCVITYWKGEVVVFTLTRNGRSYPWDFWWESEAYRQIKIFSTREKPTLQIKPGREKSPTTRLGMKFLRGKNLECTMHEHMEAAMEINESLRYRFGEEFLLK